MNFAIDSGFVAEINHKSDAALNEDYEHLGRVLARRGVAIEAVAEKVGAFGVATPSWGVGTGGTRFARFPGVGEPRHLRDLRPGGQLELVAHDPGAGDLPDDRRLDAEVRERLHELLGGAGVGELQDAEGEEPVLRGALTAGAGQPAAGFGGLDRVAHGTGSFVVVGPSRGDAGAGSDTMRRRCFARSGALWSYVKTTCSPTACCTARWRYSTAFSVLPLRV